MLLLYRRKEKIKSDPASLCRMFARLNIRRRKTYNNRIPLTSDRLNNKKNMRDKKLLAYPALAVVIILVVAGIVFYEHAKNNPENRGQNNVTLVGPGGNLPSGVPKKAGFKNFAVPVPGVLARSSQPNLAGFEWLKNHGWKSDIDVRIDGEKKDIALDSKIPGFNALGLNYKEIPIPDMTAPTAAQADEFLRFVTDPKNQPTLIHCSEGIGRTGVLVAVYRYSVQGWSMNAAIREADLFKKKGALDQAQLDFLKAWAETHTPGSFK